MDQFRALLAQLAGVTVTAVVVLGFEGDPSTLIGLGMAAGGFTIYAASLLLMPRARR